MKIGIVALNVSSFGKIGFYNSQEIGLARKLVSNGHYVIVYKLIKSLVEVEKIQYDDNLVVVNVNTHSIGSNGIPNMEAFDKTLDCMICFSDTQIFFPQLYRWGVTHHVKVIPYVGEVKSNSTNIIIKSIINILYKKNEAIYKKCIVLAKTPLVEEYLEIKGCKVLLSPVGLDEKILNNNFERISCNKIRKEFSIPENYKVVLFVGRMEDEKRPLELIDIFDTVHQQNRNTFLIIIGKGILYKKVQKKIKNLHLEKSVLQIPQIENDKMWKMYHMSDCFLNLNRHEIFGMSILEAMYYKCLVIASDAKGPSYIIGDDKYGYLCETDEKIINILKDNIDATQIKENAQRYIKRMFMWEKTVRNIEQINGNDI